MDRAGADRLAEPATWPPQNIGAVAALLVGLVVGTVPARAAEAESPAVDAPALESNSEISFPRQVLPILSQNCFACHGPDEGHRAADLRLDDQQSAIDAGVIVPGEPDDSELIRRVMSDDDAERMPPTDSGKSLSETQKELLKQWVAQGAEYERHWGFVPPQRPEEPDVQNVSWVRNPIDQFVLARLEQEERQPAPEADRYTLVRRLYLDLIGLPPTPEQADAFVRDSRSDAYERLVDQLLNSPHYGERWARWWLDLARYADTHGYEKDRPRSIWPYRDWVIDALNDDMPFDQFSIEQLAGDMLPDATDSQRIATGFHRNTMLNEEGGIDPLEFRFYAMVDRVATTGTVWLGLTTGCAQCHTHKYDPISHREYYQLMALLNNADEPDLIVYDRKVAEERAAMESEMARIVATLNKQFPLPDSASADGLAEVERQQLRERHLRERLEQWVHQQQKFLAPWTTLVPQRLESNLPRLEVLDDGSIFASGDITKRDVYTLEFDIRAQSGRLTGSDADEADGRITALRLEVLPDDRLPARGPGLCYYEGPKGDFFLSEIQASVDGQPIDFAKAAHTYGKNGLGSGSAEAKNVLDGEGSTGWSTAGRTGERHQLVLVTEKPLPTSGKLRLEMVFERHYAASLGRFRWSATAVSDPPVPRDHPEDVERILAKDMAQWSADERQQVRRRFLMVCDELAGARKPLEALQGKLPPWPTTMVMSERPADNPRPTYVHHRGEYLSPREPVVPAVPAIFPPLPSDSPANRLTFAKWLVSDRNPLIGRVTVNRIWRNYFGYGLVRTNGDYGTQAEPPTHPALLDWLACELVEGGWSLKHLHRTIVTSATYRQSSHITAEHLAADPENRLLARGGRFRLDGEIVRDVMLASSGKLSRDIGGPSVFPPQPASVTALSYGAFPWHASPGSERYRRSLYTFAKRTTPFAAYLVFDGPTGETCVVRRDRSNTPLQALTLLNDPMYTELARALAGRAISEAARDVANAGDPALLADQGDRATATRLFRHLLTRPPEEAELARVLRFHQQQRARLERNELSAASILGRPDATPDEAAWALVARAMMNLDEVITRQ